MSGQTVWVLVSPFTDCVTLGKCLNLSEPRSPPVKWAHFPQALTQDAVWLRAWAFRVSYSHCLILLAGYGGTGGVWLAGSPWEPSSKLTIPLLSPQVVLPRG